MEANPALFTRISGVVLPWFGAANVFELPREGAGRRGRGQTGSRRRLCCIKRLAQERQNTCRRKSLMPWRKAVGGRRAARFPRSRLPCLRKRPKVPTGAAGGL